jgi:hypothetical protein
VSTAAAAATPAATPATPAVARQQIVVQQIGRHRPQQIGQMLVGVATLFVVEWLPQEHPCLRHGPTQVQHLESG